MHKYVLLLCIALSCIATSVAQPEFDLVADMVQFRVDDRRVLWEFHYAFPDTALRYVPSNGAFVGELYMRLTLHNTLGDTVRQEWIASVTATSAKPPHQRSLSGLRPFVINAGQYTCDLWAYDVSDTAYGIRTSFTANIRNYNADVSMSDIMFTLPGTTADPSLDPRFVRSGLAAIPNPRHEYVGIDPSVGVYFEVYNTKSRGVAEYVVTYDVLDYVRREVMSTSLTRDGSPADAMIERVDIPAGVFPTGVYYLRVSVKSADKERTLAMREDRFFIVNPEIPAERHELLTEDERFERSEWATHRGERLDLEMELSEILATPTERLTMAGCTSERAKQKFLFSFWERRDDDPDTQVNERLGLFRTCFSRAQSYYASPAFPNGWKSDRGRTLLKYGIPTQIDQRIQSIDTKPYEEWFYQGLQGGVYFYFVDRWNDGNHKLVHSTMFGEIRDPKWKERYGDAFSPNPDPSRKSRDDNR